MLCFRLNLCCLPSSELASRIMQEINLPWRKATAHKRYDCDRPGVALIGAEKSSIRRLLSESDVDIFVLYGIKVYTL